MAYVEGEARGQHTLFPTTLDELIPRIIFRALFNGPLIYSARQLSCKQAGGGRNF